ISLNLCGACGIEAQRGPLGRKVHPITHAGCRIVTETVDISGVRVSPPVGPDVGDQVQVRIAHPHVHLDIDGIDLSGCVSSSRTGPEMNVICGRRGIEGRAAVRPRAYVTGDASLSGEGRTEIR